MVRPPRKGPIIRQRRPLRSGADSCPIKEQGSRSARHENAHNSLRERELCIRKELYKRTQFAAVAGFLITSRSEAREPYHFHAFQGVRPETFVEKIGASHPQGGFEVIKITG